ncbi:MAG: tetratricopeptide repeat protein [Bacteroidetes bacterium]|nr:tetratricopeptide repeat protein [Bacteroidota bacterium]
MSDLFKIFSPIFVLILLFLFPITLFPQNTADTLETARQLRDHGKNKEAYSILKKYEKHHSRDFNTLWLYGQLSYLNSRFGKSKSLYEKAIQSSPRNLYLQLDYGKMLVNIGEFDKAKPYLTTYSEYDPGNSQVYASLAKIDYWQGDYNAALKKLERIRPTEKESRDINMLRENIRISKTPWISVTEGYVTDNQPMQSYTTQLQGGLYLHPLSFLNFDVEVPVFLKEGATYSAFWFQAGNKAIIGKAGINIDADLGILKFPVGNKTTWTGKLTFEKKLFRHLRITLKAERSPYFYTIRSIDTAIIENQYAAMVRWDKFRSWSGEAAYNFHRFPFDKNNLVTVYGWVFTPPLRLSVFEFRIGYSFNHSTTDKLHFVPEKTLAEILTNYDATAQIHGIYNPYFTPKNQVSHSAMLGITIFPWKPIDFSINASFGIIGSAMIPYFYLDSNAVAETYINQGLVKVRYTPIQVNALANIHLSRVMKLQLLYTFHRTYYFTSNYAGIGIRINLWNGKKE